MATELNIADAAVGSVRTASALIRMDTVKRFSFIRTWAIGATLATAGFVGTAQAEFRINPYLQQPSSDGMLFTWFSLDDQAGSIEITGPGLGAPLLLNSTPDFRPEMEYTAAELNQNITGLTQGEWLIGNGTAHKHSVPVSGLMPDTTYTYTVKQGSETFSRQFKTAPTANDWSHIRFVAMADSETEPAGRVTYREWAPGPGGENRPDTAGSAWVTKFGTATNNGVPVLRYAQTETEGYTNNLKIVDSRNPDFVVMPGDLVQGSGYQPAWDEFFRHNAGEFGDNLSKRPIIAAYGNWETYANSVNGGYGNSNDRSPVVLSRHRFKTFIDGPDNGTPEHQDNYHRIDYGPVTIITLDSTKGMPDDFPRNYPAEEKLTGQQYTGPGTDTQSSFESDNYATAAANLGLTNDLSPYNEGSIQWNWAQQQLADARAAGQIVFVQFHHAPYSDGEHGLPMNHAETSGQGGTPMRIYHQMFEEYGVVAVLSGHSEMFERSFVDEDGDGIGVHYYDVGVSGDGLRGEKRTSPGFFEGEDSNRLQYNPFSQWSADEHEPEQWELVNNVLQLIDGGKHYGHLEVNVERLLSPAAPGAGTEDPYARITLTPVYSFPLLDEDYNLLGTERRIYGDEIVLIVNSQGQVIPEPASLSLLAVGGLALLRRRQR